MLAFRFTYAHHMHKSLLTSSSFNQNEKMLKKIFNFETDFHRRNNKTANEIAHFTCLRAYTTMYISCIHLEIMNSNGCRFLTCNIIRCRAEVDFLHEMSIRFSIDLNIHKKEAENGIEISFLLCVYIYQVVGSAI